MLCAHTMTLVLFKGCRNLPFLEWKQITKPLLLARNIFHQKVWLQATSQKLFRQIFCFKIANVSCIKCLRPYHVEYTSSRPITEVKQHWAELVLGWVTAWEYSVPHTCVISVLCFKAFKFYMHKISTLISTCSTVLFRSSLSILYKHKSILI